MSHPSGIGVSAVILAVALAAGAWAGEATDIMRNSSLEVQRIMMDEEMRKPEHDQDRWHRLEKTNAALFHYEDMARRSLGAHWATLNEQEREEFVAAFQNLLSAVYSKIQGAAGKYVEYLTERRESEYTEVQTMVPSYKTDLRLNYRLARVGGNWRIYDIVLDGVSMVENYRGQFSRLIKHSSFGSLVDQLRHRSLEVRY
jgi:phospholipid transport system substrate-binding protein